MWTPRRTVIALGAVTLAAGTLMLLGRGSEGTNDQSSPLSGSPVDTATAETSVPVPDPTEIDEPVVAAPVEWEPLEFERSADGARGAAIAYLETTEEAVTLSPEEAAAGARSMASAAFADDFAADTEARMAELWESIPAGITLRLAPIETRVSADGDAWRVSVWFVEAITVGTDAVVDDWRTASYRLVWEEGTWKIDEFASERGPMPGRGSQPASASPSAFEALLSGFDDEGLS